MESVLPYICTDGASDAIDFYVKAFGAEELYRLVMPDGRIPHAQIKIGDATLLISDQRPDEDWYEPNNLGGVSVQFTINVADHDALEAMWAQAQSAGAKVEREIADRFYGRRSGTLRDPFGHRWSISTVVEDVSPEEQQRRLPEEMARRTAPQFKKV